MKEKNTGKKLRVRVISSKNVVIVTCIQVTKIVKKNLAQAKKDKKEREREKKSERWRARFLICVNQGREGEKKERRLRHRQSFFSL
jgi:hypothetical protein